MIWLNYLLELEMLAPHFVNMARQLLVLTRPTTNQWTSQQMPDLCPILNFKCRVTMIYIRYVSKTGPMVGDVFRTVYGTCFNHIILPKVPNSGFPGPRSLLVFAPPCSSWTRVSRGTTMRTMLNPMGLAYEFIQAANLTISR